MSCSGENCLIGSIIGKILSVRQHNAILVVSTPVFLPL